ncbi:hypothetical protein HMPREF9120_02506 [Neisseria sp. oral taxon 020 str. F0370]|nr:hypothetical protein HMPREF9120_02506 [Neisseria sp. oral taxon 020 str. F0370]
MGFGCWGKGILQRSQTAFLLSAAMTFVCRFRLPSHLAKSTTKKAV